MTYMQFISMDKVLFSKQTKRYKPNNKRTAIFTNYKIIISQ